MAIIGITDDGRKYVLDVMPAPSESYEACCTALQRVEARGLDVSRLRMATADGCPGITKALEVEMLSVPRQRYTVHKMRNVLRGAAPAVKAEAAKDARRIWNAPNKSEARHRQLAYTAKSQAEHPKLAAIVEQELEATLTFYDVDANT